MSVVMSMLMQTHHVFRDTLEPPGSRNTD